MIDGLNISEGDGYINVRWEEPYDGGHALLGYRISKGSDEEELSPFLELDPGSMFFKDNEVENGEWYVYGIQAFNDLGEAEMAIVTGAPGKVAGPVVLMATPGDGVVELSWAEPKDTGGFDEYHYGIERGTSVTELLPLAETGNRTYSDTNVTNGVLYRYRVFVINHIGEGARGEIVSATPVGPPSPPLDPVAVAGNGSVILSWALPANENGGAITMYKVYRGRDPGNLTFLSNVTGLSLTDDDVFNGVRYHYAISALNSGGEGNKSLVVEAMPRGPPGPIRQLTATEGDGSVKVSWEEPAMDNGAEVLGYKVYLRKTGSNWSLPGEANDTSHTVTGLTNGQTYQLKVVAFNVVGEGPAPDMLNVTPGKVPAGPTDLRAKLSDDKVELSWGPPADDGGHTIIQYRVYRGTSKDDMVHIATCNETNFIDKEVDKGVKYHYKVTAINIRGEGDPSDTVSATSGTSGPLSGIMLPLALVLVIVVVVIGLLLVMRQRGKGPKPEENGNGETE
jgi:titin